MMWTWSVTIPAASPPGPPTASSKTSRGTPGAGCAAAGAATNAIAATIHALPSFICDLLAPMSPSPARRGRDQADASRHSVLAHQHVRLHDARLGAGRHRQPHASQGGA